MALVSATLASALAAAFTKQRLVTSLTTVKSPKITPALADDLGSAYHSYATAAMCAGMSPSGGSASAVAGALKNTDYFDGWEKGLKDYWSPVTFAGGGYIPANPCDPSAVACKAPIRALLPDPAGDLSAPTPGTIMDFCLKLAAILDTHTKKVTVLTTTTSTPPVVVAKDSIS